MRLPIPLLTWLGAALLVGTSLTCLLWVPYRPLETYRAIPAQATLLSSHQHLAQRWNSLASNALIKACLTPPRAAPKKRFFPAERLASDISSLAQSCAWLADKETLIAYLPSLTPARESAWIFSSWIGTRSLILRWALSLKIIPGFDRTANYCNERPIWVFRQALTPAGARLAIACGEGVLWGCLSRDPDAAMRQIILCYDGWAPSMAASLSTQPERPWVNPIGANQDQGWLRYPCSKPTPHASDIISYSLSRLKQDSLIAEIKMPPAVQQRAPLAKIKQIAIAQQLLGELPALLAILPLDLLPEQSAGGDFRPTWLNILQQALAPIASNDNALILALLSGEYGGGLGQEPWRIKIPALLALLKVQPAENSHQLVNRILDKLNANYKLGLIIDPGTLKAGAIKLQTIEAILPNHLAGLALEDRPAYAMLGPWMIFSSNAGSLIKLLERYQSIPTPQLTGAAERWQNKFSQSNPSAFLWMDLDICGRILQLPLTALSAALQLAQPAASNKRPNLGAGPAADSAAGMACLKNCLEKARGLKTGALWMESGPGDSATLRLEIGPGSMITD